LCLTTYLPRYFTDLGNIESFVDVDVDADTGYQGYNLQSPHLSIYDLPTYLPRYLLWLPRYLLCDLVTGSPREGERGREGEKRRGEEREKDGDGAVII